MQAVTKNPYLSVRDVDFNAPAAVDQSDFGLEGLHGAAARLSVDLSPTSGLGVSRLVQVRRMDGLGLAVNGRSWWNVQTSIGAGAILVEPTLAVTVADLLMGGSGSVAGRPLTSVEERVMTPHLQRALDALVLAFVPAGVTSLKVKDPGRGSLALRGDFFVIDISVESGSKAGTSLGDISLVVPAPAPTRRYLAPVVDDAVLVPGSAMGHVPVTLSLRTMGTYMPASVARELHVDQLVLTKHKVSAPLAVAFGPVDVAVGDLGSHEQSLTVHILSRIDTEPSRKLPRTSRIRRLSSPVLPIPSAEEPNPKGTTDMDTTSDPSVAAAVAAAEDALSADGLSTQQPMPLGPLADVPVEVSVEVGRTSVSLREAVNLTPGQVVALDAEADAPAVVLVNGRPVARGQVVVVDDVYGVRISELIEE